MVHLESEDLMAPLQTEKTAVFDHFLRRAKKGTIAQEIWCRRKEKMLICECALLY